MPSLTRHRLDCHRTAGCRCMCIPHVCSLASVVNPALPTNHASKCLMRHETAVYITTQFLRGTAKLAALQYACFQHMPVRMAGCLEQQ